LASSYRRKPELRTQESAQVLGNLGCISEESDTSDTTIGALRAENVMLKSEISSMKELVSSLQMGMLLVYFI